jgi:hypothetical protein
LEDAGHVKFVAAKASWIGGGGNNEVAARIFVPAPAVECRATSRLNEQGISMEKLPAQHQSEHQVLGHIQDLVDEEHRLLAKGALEPADHDRLAHVQVELDQCWDLLRQRRARSETGGDPERAEVRPPDVVERYVG